MRKFGTDKPEVMSFTLGNSKKVYNLPLASSLPISTVTEMQKASEEGDYAMFEFQLKLLRQYVGDVIDTLTAGDVRDIFIAWNEESSKQGADAGE